MAESVAFEIGGFTGWRVYFLYIPEVVEVVTQAEVKVAGDGL